MSADIRRYLQLSQISQLSTVKAIFGDFSVCIKNTENLNMNIYTEAGVH